MAGQSTRVRASSLVATGDFPPHAAGQPAQEPTMRTRVPYFLRLTLILLGLLTISGRAEASGFVYVAVPAQGCLPTPCATPLLVVVDASTMRTVIRIPLPAGTVPVAIAMSPDGGHLYVSNRTLWRSRARFPSSTRAGTCSTRHIPCPKQAGSPCASTIRGCSSRAGTPSPHASTCSAPRRTPSSIRLSSIEPAGIATAGSVDRLYVFEQTGTLPNCAACLASRSSTPVRWRS